MQRTTTLAAMAVSFAAAGPAIAADICHPPPPRRVAEVFVSADCDACWQHADAPTLAPGTLRLDWVVPGLKGDEAPLAVAAVSESQARLKHALAPEGGTLQAQALAPWRGLSLKAEIGLAWNGYLGIAITATRAHNAAPLPADARAWLALIERVPAGEDGTPVARQLVRTVIGPLPLAWRAGQASTQELRAVLIPPNAKADRLATAAWVERADGRMLAAAESAPAGCEAGS